MTNPRVLGRKFIFYHVIGGGRCSCRQSFSAGRSSIPNSAGQTVIVESHRRPTRKAGSMRATGSAATFGASIQKTLNWSSSAGSKSAISAARKSAPMSPASPSIRRGDLFLTAGGFSEVLRIRGRNLDVDEPGVGGNLCHPNRRRQRHRLRQKRQSLCDRRTETAGFIAPVTEGGKAQVVAQIAAHRESCFRTARPSNRSRQTALFSTKRRTHALHRRYGARGDLEIRHRRRRPRRRTDAY